MFDRPLVPILLTYLSGIIIAHFLFPDQTTFIPFFCLIIALVVIFLLVIERRGKVSCLLILFFSLGSLAYLSKLGPSEIQALAKQQQRVILEGVVREPPKIDRQKSRFLVRARLMFDQGRCREMREDVLVTIYRCQEHFSPGDRIRFPARLSPFNNFNNPGRYNYELAMKARGIACAASVSDGRYVVFMGRRGLGPLLDYLEAVRRPVRHLFQRLPSPESQALYSAILLGERRGIDKPLREVFDRTGLGHLLAVSGLHIGLVAGLVFFVIKKVLSFSYTLSLKWNIHKLAACLSCLPVVFYTGLTGFQTSGLRAMIMVLAYLLSIILGRERDIWSTLALAGLIILGIDPLSLFTVSFQLSFLAVVGILWLTPVLLNKIPDPEIKGFYPGSIPYRVCQYFSGLIIVTLAVTIFLLPIISFYFHRLSLVTVPANLMAVPLLGLWILPLGLVSIICLPFSGSLSYFFLYLGSRGLDTMSAIIGFWADFDFSSFWVITPNIWEIALYYGFIFSLYLLLKKVSWAKFFLAVVILFIAGDIGYWLYQTRFLPDLRVTYLDVGQGNATLVRFPGHKRMLIDGGGFRGGSFDTGQMIIAPYLWQLKIKKIDYLVLSHPEIDHMGGLGFVAAHFRPGEFWWNGDKHESETFAKLMEIVEGKRIKKLLPADLGEQIEIGRTELRLLHPLPSYSSTKTYQGRLNLNNNSLVLKLTHEGRSLLFPGDLENKGEVIVTANAGSELKSNVLLAPHHGSRTSCNKRFLDKVAPALCIISSGRNNHFGFPHQETLARIEQAQGEVLRIDRVGAIELKVNKKGLGLQTYLRQEKDVLKQLNQRLNDEWRPE